MLGTGFATRMPTVGFYIALVVSTAFTWWSPFAVMGTFALGRAAVPVLLAAKGAASGTGLTYAHHWSRLGHSVAALEALAAGALFAALLAGSQLPIP